MSNQKPAILIGSAVVLLTAMYSGPGYSSDDTDSPETWGKYYPDWGHEWTAVSVALTPGGSVSGRLPDLARERLETLMERFVQRFGSAAKHGLKHGQVVSEEFCPPEASSHWGDLLARHLGSTLLLSEVAVRATIESVAFGFSTGGAPEALIRLADVEPLTGRSPVPEYAVVPLGQLVVDDRVFCGERGPLASGEWRGPYQPTVGSQVVLIGGRRDGTVFFGPGHDSWYAEVRKNSGLQWIYGFQGRSLSELKARVAELEAGGLFARTDGMAQAEADPHERMAFARAWSALVDSGCRPSGFREGTSLELTCGTEH